jgi:CheY-like chemotaxis protein
MIKVILHVEDDENDVLLFEHALSKAQVDNPVHVASNGRQAIEYLKGEGRFGDRDEFPLPHIVLLDLKLPLVPGLDVLKWIRNEARLSIPVIILTSSENEADMQAAYELCANAYLVKPNEVGKLAEIARAIKDFWLTLNCLPMEPRPFPCMTGDERKAATADKAGKK